MCPICGTVGASEKQTVAEKTTISIQPSDQEVQQWRVNWFLDHGLSGGHVYWPPSMMRDFLAEHALAVEAKLETRLNEPFATHRNPKFGSGCDL